MRRLPALVTSLVATVAATGCIYERDVVRDDRRVESAPPGPGADVVTSSVDPGYPGYDAPPPPPAGSEITSETVFYDRLSPYGSWTYLAPYGQVWVPAVGYGWRPYYYGQWVLTDWGWTFVSDDPWAWAAYHYGRWNFGLGVGWYWVPGRVWAPAWVSWRYGAGYVTWCPLGPSGVVFGYRHPAWVAVPERHFTRPIAGVAIPAQRTYAAVNETRPLTGPHVTVGRGGSFGPPVAGVARATGQQIHPAPAAQVVRPRPVASSNAGAPMRSPVQPRNRENGARPVPAARPSAGPRPVPVRPGSAAPRIESGPSGGARPSAPPPASAPAPAPRAAPPPSAPAPRAAPSSGGGGGQPHATSPRTQ